MPTETQRPTPRSEPVPTLSLLPGGARAGHAHMRSPRTPILVGGAALAASTAGALAIAATASAAPSIAHPTIMSEGTSGPAVAKVQHALHIRANGHFNHRTERAVVAFQRRHDLQTDGIVGPQTWDALFHIAAATPTSAATTDGAATSTATSEAAPSGADAGSGGYSIPSAIVQCESGGNYSAVNPSSGAGGAYQILPSTWAAYGGQGLPQDASPSEQSAIAARIYASQGPGAWTC